jgi:hypothetical protein
VPRGGAVLGQERSGTFSAVRNRGKGAGPGDTLPQCVPRAIWAQPREHLTIRGLLCRVQSIQARQARGSRLTGPTQTAT